MGTSAYDFNIFDLYFFDLFDEKLMHLKNKNEKKLTLEEFNTIFYRNGYFLNKYNNSYEINKNSCFMDISELQLNNIKYNNLYIKLYFINDGNEEVPFYLQDTMTLAWVYVYWDQFSESNICATKYYNFTDLCNDWAFMNLHYYYHYTEKKNKNQELNLKCYINEEYENLIKTILNMNDTKKEKYTWPTHKNDMIKEFVDRIILTETYKRYLNIFTSEKKTILEINLN
jgi:hypothetical protein